MHWNLLKLKYVLIIKRWYWGNDQTKDTMEKYLTMHIRQRTCLQKMFPLINNKKV